MRPIFDSLRCSSLSRLVVAIVMAAVGVQFGGCNRGGQGSAANADSGEGGLVSRAPESSLSSQQLYEAKRYPEAKALALQEAQQSAGHEKEVSLLTAGLSAHAMQQYDDAATLLTPLTRSDDPRIAGRAKSALDYIGIERARKSPVMASQASPGGQATTVAASGKSFTLQAGVFTSLANAKKRASQLRASAAKAGLGEPKIVPDTINGNKAFAVQVGTFRTKQAANDARGLLNGPVVVTAVP